MHTLKRLMAVLVFVATAACQAPGGGNTDLSQRTINVVTTIGMITDIVQNVGGERVQATGLMGPGIDPYLYKASEGDVARLQQADIVFYNDLHLEAQMGGVLERIADGRMRTVAVTDPIDRAVLLAPPEFKGNYDPRAWFDVNL